MQRHTEKVEKIRYFITHSITKESAYLGLYIYDLTHDIGILNDKIHTDTCILIASKLRDTLSYSLYDVAKFNEGTSIIDIVSIEKKIVEYFKYQVPRYSVLHHINETITEITNTLDNEIIRLCHKLVKYIVIDGMYIDYSQKHVANMIFQFCVSVANDAIYDGYSSYFVWLIIKYSKNEHLKSYMSEFKQDMRSLLNMPQNKFQPNDILISGDIMKNYATAKYIDRGTYGEVRKIEYNQKMYAIKKIIMKEADYIDGLTYNVVREMSALKILNHENVIKIHAVYYDVNEYSIYLLLDLMYYDLDTYVKRKTMLNYVKLSMISQLLRGVMYMHSMKIMHRDLSSRNILIKNSNLKIADFGLSKTFSTCTDKCYSDGVCTISFRAFEVLTGKPNYTYTIDIWSCACIILFILFGKYPFVGNNEDEMVHDILTKMGTPGIDYFVNETHWINTYPLYEMVGFGRIDIFDRETTSCLYNLLSYVPSKRTKMNKMANMVEKIMKYV